MILSYYIYNASEFELKILRRVRFWNEDFTTREILKKNKFLKSMILKKKIWTHKITFCLILTRKMRKFCVLRAYLRSTILKKKKFFKKHDFEEKYFSKKHDFEWKSFVKSVNLNKDFFVLSDFETKFFPRVRF